MPDPYFPQTLNRYSYCYNNPLIYVDPSGHISWESAPGAKEGVDGDYYNDSSSGSGGNGNSADSEREYWNRKQKEYQEHLEEIAEANTNVIRDPVTVLVAGLVHVVRQTLTTVVGMTEVVAGSTAAIAGALVVATPGQTVTEQEELQMLNNAMAKGKAGRKKQGREIYEKKRKNKKWKKNNNKRGPVKPKKHTPGRGHRRKSKPGGGN